jgi:hypothetical protein
LWIRIRKNEFGSTSLVGRIYSILDLSQITDSKSPFNNYEIITIIINSYEIPGQEIITKPRSYDTKFCRNFAKVTKEFCEISRVCPEIWRVCPEISRNVQEFRETKFPRPPYLLIKKKKKTIKVLGPVEGSVMAPGTGSNDNRSQATMHPVPPVQTKWMPSNSSKDDIVLY